MPICTRPSSVPWWCARPTAGCRSASSRTALWSSTTSHGRREDRLAGALVDRHADREGALHRDSGIEEAVGAPGRVGAHEDRGLLVIEHLVGELVEGLSLIH